MLVLTRKQRQQITIGDNITITVLRVKGQAVRIGIEAPDGIRILRAELNAIDKAFEDESLLEDMSTSSGAQRAENNNRRSQVGKQSSANADRLTKNPTCQQKNSAQISPLSGMRTSPVSLLSFR